MPPPFAKFHLALRRKSLDTPDLGELQSISYRIYEIFISAHFETQYVLQQSYDPHFEVLGPN